MTQSQLVFATQNPNKTKEIEAQIGKDYTIRSLLDLAYTNELEETQNTLEGNAFQKARFVANHFKVNCFADDTGLEVEALNGAPGVYSARYAGKEKSFEANMNKLLAELREETNRKARFRTVIALILNDKEYTFEGICEGSIINEKRGAEGFGYDPIFQPSGFEHTFAEMDLDLKAKIGHRGKAVAKLIGFLKAQLIQ